MNLLILCKLVPLRPEKGTEVSEYRLAVDELELLTLCLVLNLV